MFVTNEPSESRPINHAKIASVIKIIPLSPAKYFLSCTTLFYHNTIVAYKTTKRQFVYIILDIKQIFKLTQKTYFCHLFFVV